ncbi:signal transduction histidine kinase [Rhizobium sp. PP-F2F-G38]|uniref:histidine kinase n=1 Tax=Ferranicluibacter rubi TaxID=2715133 RepID=A0AA43ZHI1_9HYPH|nr:PAS-domain containing protein [Ferranicluibacter rubi]NHT76972.1 histidine kinase [Ferranicluibacter rubi]PYE92548.1 signal transduction histidine kinase [Rhizobium sp. PP-F2F-G38]TCQ04263.1 signal transduction histidine kinase [Rhizobium sp. PP-F2F-G36]
MSNRCDANAIDGREDATGLLHATIDNFPGGICVLDNDLTMLVTNRKFYELLDLSEDMFPAGSNFEGVFRYNACRGEYGPGDPKEKVRERLSQVRRFEEHRFDREVGTGLVIEMRSAPKTGGGCVLTYLDVTVNRRAEQALLRHKETLEELVLLRTEEIERQAEELRRLLGQERHTNELQRQFVTMTSHEFRTPLAIIDGAAQRLQRRKHAVTSEFIEDKVGLIRGAVSRMVDLMESFLSAGRIEHGHMTYAFRPCSLREVVERCVARQQSIATTHHFHLKLDDLPPVVVADTAAMEQVFTNLISNAVKYAPVSPDIYITGHSEGNGASVTVADTGVGIDADDLPKMFQRYFRARTSTGIAGTGIGLNLVKQIVEAHKGNIFLESRKGQGTAFTVTLPVTNPMLIAACDEAKVG